MNFPTVAVGSHISLVEHKSDTIKQFCSLGARDIYRETDVSNYDD